MSAYGSELARHELNMHASHLLSPAQRELIARDFADRLETAAEGDGSAVNEWPLYLADIGGYGNMRSYAEALAAGAECRAAERLEYLRGELRAGRMSYGELGELQDLIPFIDAGDVELLEAAGVPEFPDDQDTPRDISCRHCGAPYGH